MTGDGLAVGPLGVGAQMKRVNAPILRNIPPLRHPANRVIAVGAFGDEAFEERVDDFVFRYTRDDLRVEILRLGAVAKIQDRARSGVSRRGGLWGLGVGFAATSEDERGHQQRRAMGD